MQLEAGRVWNLIDNLFVKDSLRDGEVEGAQTKVRTLVYEAYDSTYRTLEDPYGGSNDVAGLEEPADGDELPPFVQFDPKRKAQPYATQLTPETDTGFAGLEPPMA